MHLERAFRVLPHHNNTGGFFVAVLRKVAETPRNFTVSSAGPEPAPQWVPRPPEGEKATAEGDAKAPEAQADPPKAEELAEQQAKNEEEEADKEVQQVLAMVDGTDAGEDKKKKKPFNEDPFVMLEAEIFNPLKEFYGMTDDFRREHLFGRSALGRKVYFLNPAVSTIVSNPQNHKLKIVHTGLRCFESRHELEKGIAKWSEKEGSQVTAGYMYRICQEGVYHVKPLMTKQILHCDRQQFIHILKEGTVRFDTLKASGDAALTSLQEQIDQTRNGCVVAALEAASSAEQLPCICLWRTSSSVTLMISKEDKQFYAETLDIKLD